MGWGPPPPTDMIFSNMNTILLDLLAFGSVLSGILVITSRNPIISVLFLIAVFVNVACYLILLGINFIGITYLIIYVGAIAILFLFVVMMINVKLAEIHQTTLLTDQHLPLALIIGTTLLTIGSDNGWNNLSLIYLFDWINSLMYNIPMSSTGQNMVNINTETFKHFVGAAPTYLWDNSFNYFSQIESIGNSLYTSHSLWIVILSIVLLVAMVGPIVLTHNPTTRLH